MNNNLHEHILINYPDVLSVKQLQEVLQVGRNKAYELIRQNEIRSLKIGKNIRIPKVYLIDFMLKNGYNKDKYNEPMTCGNGGA